MADSEFVYILTNPCMPDWIKVGKAKNVNRRLSDLNCTAVPLPFECYAYLEVPSDLVFNVEHGLHAILGRSLDKKKEFFRTKPEIILDYFKTVEGLNKAFHLVVNPDLESKQDMSIASRTTFELLGVPAGAVLTFVRDSSVTCTVADSINQVMYKGEQWSISGLACDLCKYRINGFRAFMYEDETLWQRRLRLSSKKN